ncbi:dihydrodipicolinate synthase family protein [Paludibaculum fermentans]|uniref:dihydrodipicolinate synthase family protein n=1 Tax=Paludibaculum fermentans TaxID=1473598 RepID=UPI003EC0AB7B
MAVELQGIYPAVITPMTTDGVFMPEAFEALCGRLYQDGVDGLYVCGQTGEGLSMSLEQRKAVAERAVEATPTGRQVIVHVGASSTAAAMDLARHAARVGAHALSSLPPAGSYSMDEVYGYYEALAGATDLPFLVYYYPGHAAHPRTYDELMRLCEIPNVAGLKFTSTDLYLLRRLKDNAVTVFSGFDEILAAGLLMGADGGIGSFYNVAARWFVELYQAARRGDWERARVLQSKVNGLVTIGLRYQPHAAVKEILRWQGLDCGVCAAPRRRLTPAEVEQLQAELNEGATASLRPVCI